MDNLTHSLAGAVLGQMGLKRKTGLAMPMLIIAANIPDIDAVAVLLGGHQHLAIRRGITHGPIAMVLLPLLLWAAMLAYDKWRPNERRLPVHKGWLLALAYIGTLSHPALDWLNSYGIRLLEPFSSQWFYGDSIFIIDIWIWIALGMSVWLSLRRERGGESNWTRPAWTGFCVVCAYIFANGVITRDAEAQGLWSLEERGGSLRADVVANPVPVQFWKREILWRDDFDYGRGRYVLGQGVVLSKDVRAHNMNDGLTTRTIPVRVVTEKGSDADAFLFWSRMPVLEMNDNALVVRDQRFEDPRVGDRFTLRMPRSDNGQ